MLEETAHRESDGLTLALASQIKNKVASNVKGGFTPLPGKRNHFSLLLAQLHPIPKGDAANKAGMWSSNRLIYLQTGASQEFKTFNSSIVTASASVIMRQKTTQRKGAFVFALASACAGTAPKFNFGEC